MTNIVFLLAGFVCFLCCGGFINYSPSVKTNEGVICFLGGAIGMLSSLIIMGIAVTTKF